MSRTPVGIQLAALYARDDDFAFLQRTIDAIAVAADDQDPFQTLDMRFHIGIACAIGNITVLRLAKLLTGTLWAARKLLPTYGLETPDFTLETHHNAGRPDEPKPRQRRRGHGRRPRPTQTRLAMRKPAHRRLRAC